MQQQPTKSADTLRATAEFESAIHRRQSASGRAEQLEQVDAAYQSQCKKLKQKVRGAVGEFSLRVLLTTFHCLTLTIFLFL